MPLLMRRRPLLRAAAVGGGAYHMGRVRAESQAREAEQNQRLDDLDSQQQYAPPPEQAAPAAPSGVSIERLQQLGKLHEEGILTDEEFAQQKAKELGN